MEHVANTDYIQAAVEIFGALICLVILLIIASVTQEKEKSIRILLWIFSVSILSLLCDAGGYIFDGDSSSTGVLINHICNLGAFLSSTLEAMGAAAYTYQLVIERGGRPQRIWVSLAHTIGVFAIISTIVNEFVPWIFSFDQWNIYYRMSGWWIYAFGNLLSLTITMIMILRSRKNLGRDNFWPMIIFIFAPYIGLVLQSLIAGASLVNLGVAISLLYIMFNYLRQWMKKKEGMNVKKKREKTVWIFMGLFGVMILCTSASTVVNVISIQQLAAESSENNSREIAQMVRGELRSICGTDFTLEKTAKLFSEYEERYDLEISLIDEAGLLMADSELSGIGKSYLEHDYLSSLEDDEIYYQKQKKTARLTCYMNSLGWYLVIRDRNPMKLDVVSILMPSLIMYIVGLGLMIALMQVFRLHERSRNNEIDDQRRLTETDQLTGLLNRHAYEKDMEYLMEEGARDYTCIVLLDINGLKTVNDTVGHDAGDELIIGASRCISEIFEESGKVYRIGGDEFVIISNTPKEAFLELIEHFKQVTDSWQGELIGELSVSLGVAAREDYPQMNVREVLKQADQLMYIDKNDFYRRTGKNRRMSW